MSSVIFDYLIEIFFKPPCNLAPGINGDFTSGIFGNTETEGRIVRQPQNERRVVAGLCEERILAILEKVVGLAIVGENRLLPTKIFLQLGIAVLV